MKKINDFVMFEKMFSWENVNDYLGEYLIISNDEEVGWVRGRRVVGGVIGDGSFEGVRKAFAFLILK